MSLFQIYILFPYILEISHHHTETATWASLCLQLPGTPQHSPLTPLLLTSSENQSFR